MSIAESTQPPGSPEPTPELFPERRQPFGERFMGILTRPSATFARMQDPDAWFWPAILMLIGYTLYMLATGVGSAQFQMNLANQMFSPSGTAGRNAPPGFQNIMLWVIPATQIFLMALSPVPSVAISWTTRVLIFTGLARLFGGVRAPWSRVFGMVGWSWTPLFFHYALLGVLMLAVPSVFRFLAAIPDTPGMPGLGNTADTLRARWQGQVFLYLSPFVLWNLWLCFLGVQELFRLPRWKAALVVLLPTVTYLLGTLAFYWLGVTMMDRFKDFGTLPPSPRPPVSAPR